MSSAKAAESPLPTGRLLTYSDIIPQLKGRQAEVRLSVRRLGTDMPCSVSLSWLVTVLAMPLCQDISHSAEALAMHCSSSGQTTRCGTLWKFTPSYQRTGLPSKQYHML